MDRDVGWIQAKVWRQKIGMVNATEEVGVRRDGQTVELGNRER